jgi:hypothetical protein
METFEQKPLAPLSAALPKDLPKSKPARPSVTPEELQTTGRFARSLKVLAGLTVAGVVAAALANRSRPHTPPPSVPEKLASAPVAPAAPAASPILGGSPKAITEAPEISFPSETPVAVETGSWPIERLPGVQASAAQSSSGTAMAQVSDGQGLAQQPGVAQLDRRLEQPKQ